ncbi:hypothetical protein ACSBR2_018477 [Camellia fascicularis]
MTTTIAATPLPLPLPPLLLLLLLLLLPLIYRRHSISHTTTTTSSLISFATTTTSYPPPSPLLPLFLMLLTPPDTPLFPSLDDETPLVTLAQKGRPQSQPITISRSSTIEKNRKSSRGLSAAPMEISLQSATDNCGADTSEQNGIVSEPPPPPLAEDKVLVSVEVCLKPSSTARIEDVCSAVEMYCTMMEMWTCSV